MSGKTEGTESNTSWDNVEFVAKKLMCLTRMSYEINEYAIVSMGDTLTREIGVAFALQEDTIGFTGTGISTDGGQVGTLVKAIDGTHGMTVVVAASGNDNLGEIDAIDLINLMAVIPQYAKPGSKWYCSPTALSLVFDAIKIAAGGNDVGRLQNMVRPFSLAMRLLSVQSFDSASTNYNDQVMIAFGNLALAATLATRRDIRVRLSNERRFELDQVGVKGTMRHSILTHDLGSNSVKSSFTVLIGTS